MTTATLAPTTRSDWESVTNRHLIPELGSIPLWKLTARDCDRLYHRMAAAGLGPSRVRCAHVVLHRAVAQAVRWGWLPRNPVSDATRPEVPRATVVPPDVDQVRVLLAAAREHDPMLACWLDVAAATGARRGEVCGLRWCDVDLDARTVRIERSVSATKKEGVSSRPPRPTGSASCPSPTELSHRCNGSAQAPRNERATVDGALTRRSWCSPTTPTVADRGGPTW